MDTIPTTARSLGRFYMTDGDTLARNYKNVLSDFPAWEQKPHAQDWVLLAENLGESMSIDESCLHEDLFTFLSNKDGHCKSGTIAAVVRGTKAEDVLKVLLQIPEEERLKVKEVTMDLSESMYSIVTRAFPNAVIVLDCFHIMKRCNEAIEELRLRYKREAQAIVKRERRAFKAKLKQRAARRKQYRKNHPKNYSGKVRGRKPSRKNEKFRPAVLSNGDTLVELLTRSKYALTTSREKWSEKQKVRMALVFERYPKLEDAYNLVNKLRSIFRSKNLDRDAAKAKLQEWYQAVTDCTLREVKAARDTIKSREDDVLNYFINHSTNASAESLNSKMKGFRSELRGVSDMPFFMYRLCKIFG